MSPHQLGINWEITRKCNLRCIYCRVSAGKGQQEEISFSQAKAVVDKLLSANYSHLKFTGGEPLLKDYYWELVKYAHRKGMAISMFTNSTLINDKMLPLIKKYISMVAISLDSLNNEHNYLLKRTRAEIVIQKIQKIKNLEVPVAMSSTVTNITINDLFDLIKKAKEIGVDEFKINDFVINGRADQNYDLLKFDQPFRNSIPSILNRIKAVFNEFLKQTDTFPCECNDNNLFIDYKGDVYPCVELSYLSKEFCLGNIVTDRVDKIFSLNKKFYIQIKKTDICSYSYISSPHFSACLNRDACPKSLINYMHRAKTND